MLFHFNYLLSWFVHLIASVWHKMFNYFVSQFHFPLMSWQQKDSQVTPYIIFHYSFFENSDSVTVFYYSIFWLLRVSTSFIILIFFSENLDSVTVLDYNMFWLLCVFISFIILILFSENPDSVTVLDYNMFAKLFVFDLQESWWK